MQMAMAARNLTGRQAHARTPGKHVSTGAHANTHGTHTHAHIHTHTHSRSTDSDAGNDAENSDVGNVGVPRRMIGKPGQATVRHWSRGPNGEDVWVEEPYSGSEDTTSHNSDQTLSDVDSGDAETHDFVHRSEREAGDRARARDRYLGDEYFSGVSFCFSCSIVCVCAHSRYTHADRDQDYDDDVSSRLTNNEDRDGYGPGAGYPNEIGFTFDSNEGEDQYDANGNLVVHDGMDRGSSADVSFRGDIGGQVILSRLTCAPDSPARQRIYASPQIVLCTGASWKESLGGRLKRTLAEHDAAKHICIRCLVACLTCCLHGASVGKWADTAQRRR